MKRSKIRNCASFTEPLPKGTRTTEAMGRHFGQLTRVRNIITYSLSPFEQRAFAGAISKGIPNMFRRFSGQVFRVVPPLALCYMVFDWGRKEHVRLQRKEAKASH